MMAANEGLAGAGRRAGGLATTMAAVLAIALATALTVAVVPQAAAQIVKGPDMKSVERGRYLVRIAGCNDCHTAGYAQSGARSLKRSG